MRHRLRLIPASAVLGREAGDGKAAPRQPGQPVERPVAGLVDAEDRVPHEVVGRDLVAPALLDGVEGAVQSIAEDLAGG